MPGQILMTPHQTETVMSIRMISTIISLALTIMAIWTMRAFKMRHGQYHLQLIVFGCTIVECLSNLISFWTFKHESQLSGLCYAQGVIMQFAQVSLFCWSAVFAFNIYMVIVHRRLDVNKYYAWYHAICWITTLICTFIPNITLAYGRTTVWCWISKEAVYGNAYRIGTFFTPFYIAWTIILFVCCSIIYRLFVTLPKATDEEASKSMNIIRRFYAYPIVFLICYIPATVNRINNWVTGNDVYWLFVIHVLASPSLGTLNALVFFSNIEVRHALSNVLIQHNCCSYCLGDVPLVETQFEHGSAKAAATYCNSNEHYSDDVILDDVILP